MSHLLKVRNLLSILVLMLLLGGCIMPPRDMDPTPVPTEPLPVEAVTPEPERLVVTVTANANVRSGPDTEYDVRFWLTEGTVVTVTERNTEGDWLQIEHGAQTGWIFAALTDAVIDVQESMPEDLEPEPTKDRAITMVPEPTEEPTEEAMPESTTETPPTVAVTGTVVNLRDRTGHRLPDQWPGARGRPATGHGPQCRWQLASGHAPGYYWRTCLDLRPPH